MTIGGCGGGDGTVMQWTFHGTEMPAKVKDAVGIIENMQLSANRFDCTSIFDSSRRYISGPTDINITWKCMNCHTIVNSRLIPDRIDAGMLSSICPACQSPIRLTEYRHGVGMLERFESVVISDQIGAIMHTYKCLVKQYWDDCQKALECKMWCAANGATPREYGKKLYADLMASCDYDDYYDE